jgi:uncharacterized protein YbaP (TraB family)
MRLPLALTAALVALPVAAAAECGGPSLTDRLDPAQRARLDAAVAAVPHPEGLIWEAVRDDDRIVLVGTMHVWDARLDAVFDLVAPYLAEADHALFEMTATEQGQLMQALADDPSLTVITHGPTLPELLDATTWDMLSEAAREHGIPPFMAAKMQPWFLATTLSMPVCAMTAMTEGRLGLDFMLMDRAAEIGVETSALEPWDTLFSLFEEASLEDQIDLLRLSLVAPDLQDEMFVAMLDGYFAARVAEVWELNRIALDFMPELTDGAAFMDETEDALLTGRNHDWIPVIESATAGHDTLFVAVGAAHLPGEDGVLQLLEDRGWTISRLDP